MTLKDITTFGYLYFHVNDIFESFGDVVNNRETQKYIPLFVQLLSRTLQEPTLTETERQVVESMRTTFS